MALRRAWNLLALPLISIALAVLVGSLVIILSQWLVAGDFQPGLALDASQRPSPDAMAAGA